MAIVLACVAFAIAIGVANKSYRNKLKSGESQTVQAPTNSDNSKPNTSVVADVFNESTSPGTNITKK